MQAQNLKQGLKQGHLSCSQNLNNNADKTLEGCTPELTGLEVRAHAT